MPRRKQQDAWDLNSLQFPRLLAELRASGLTPKQYSDLQESMDCSEEDIDELLERAEQEWQIIKDITWRKISLEVPSGDQER